MPRSNKKKTGLGKGLGALFNREPIQIETTDTEELVDSEETVGRKNSEAKSVKVSSGGKSTRTTKANGRTTTKAKATVTAKPKVNMTRRSTKTVDIAQDGHSKGVLNQSSELAANDYDPATNKGEKEHIEKNQQNKNVEVNNQVAPGEDYLAGSVLIDVAKVIPNPNQPRKNFAEDDMSSLMESINRIGVIQPIIVCKQGDVYHLVAGERRLRASKALGLEKIPALIKDYSSEEVTEVALVENLQRQNLDPIEEAFAYQRLVQTFNQTHDIIASRLGRSRSYIANIVRLLNLPEFVRNDLSAGEITIGQARPLLALTNEDQQREIWALIKEKELNARQIEALVKRLKDGKELISKRTDNSIHNTAELRALVERIKLSVGVKAAIKLKPGNKVQGRIELPFKSEEELNRLIEYMEAQEQAGAISHGIAASMDDKSSVDSIEDDTMEFKV